MTANALDNSPSFNCTTPESTDIKYCGHNLDLSEQKSMKQFLGLESCSNSINSMVFENEKFKCY